MGRRELSLIIVNASPGQRVSIGQLEKNCWPWFAQSNIFIITCTGGTSLSEVTMVTYVGSYVLKILRVRWLGGKIF